MLMAEVIPHYAAPLTGVTEYFNDHRKNIDYDVLNLHNPEESNNILQQCDQAVSFTTVSLENETQKFISKRERKHMYDFLQNKKNVDVDILYCRAIEEEDKKRHLLEEYRRLYGERKKDKEETSLSMSVPYYDKHNQISLAENPTQHNPDPAHTHHHTQTQHKHLPQDTYECKCATSGENGRRISLSLIVPCCGKDHHIDLALDCSGRGCQVTGNEGAVRHEQEESASKGSSQKKTSSFTLSVPLSEGHHLQVKTLTSSSHEATATQEISISSDSDPHICSLKKQNLKTGTKELQHCEQMSTFEMHSNVESLEKKQKTNIVKKLLHHKYKVCSPVVRRYEADRGVSCLEETFTKDCALGQKKNRDFNSWKKKIRRICHVYVPDDLEEPAFQYIPEVLPSSATIKGGVPPLQESLMLLAEGLEAGSLVAQFEQLYRRKPGLTVTEARRQDNEKKNRYRDISPYDTTRVILTSTPSGDYINASYVNMEVQGSGIINRYIASQGPLAGTCTDYWHMVWEQQSTLIVMLTTVVEQGRVKCHRYWPRHYETVDFGILQVTCNKEEETPGFAFREFTLINTETQEERHITHMQYLAWPDHGVPDDSSEFLNFVTQVRKARNGMVEPTIVHCSAGIGRTGVLILMETAQCLIEANEPIYPLDIVKAMRDQRAMMIQTASQFRFVCEAIHRVYTEELVKPLAEYQQR